MRILALGHGSGEIPPTGRGAVESVIWETALAARALGHEFDILNVRPKRIPLALPRTLREKGPFDWIWCHHERMIPWVNLWARHYGARVVMTSHRPITDLDGLDSYTRAMLRLGARARHHLCLTPEIMLLNRVLNPSCRVAHAPNGVNVAAMRVSPDPVGGAICVGGLSKRKCQADVARACGDLVSFVGPADHDDEDTRFVQSHPSYLGAWTQAELRQKLTHFRVLVLFSRAEAQPLVVGEAFAAGLSVVLSPESARNVDLSLPWVTLVRHADELPDAIRRAADENPRYRPEIRAHATQEWDWNARTEASILTLAQWMRVSNPPT